jgi:PPK2 family polyphosphate:nucleotide phosphotransferase
MPFHPAKLRVPHGLAHPLSHHEPAASLGFGDKGDALDALAEVLPELRELQNRLFAERTWSVLIILQAMDAAGKDGIVKHVFSGFNQQSCHVSAFSAPAGSELTHDFLWRCAIRLPARGEIGVFNRSYYEEALVPRIHPEFLTPQRLPAPCLATDITATHPAKKTPRSKRPAPRSAKLPAPDQSFWQARFDDINAFERHLVRSGTRVVKLFLHLSRAEQKRRFLTRINDPSRNWKFSPNDVRDRADWDKYTAAYNTLISATSTHYAPWHILPADHKYVARLAAAHVLHYELAALHPQYPKLNRADRSALKRARKLLLKE